ncbi:MAG: nucleoside hydrolase [Clostridia bacterium]|nr:nucleoside hydrolase [Clostridia bacterium]
MELINKLIKDLPGDKWSSEYVDGGVLCMSAGTPDRLIERVIEKRISNAARRAGIDGAVCEITDGFDRIKAEYEKSEEARGDVTLKITACGKTEEGTVPLEVKVKDVIYDHDLGSDCDDGGAVAVLLNAHREGVCRVLAITSCVYNPYASYCVGIMCEYFGVDDIEIGVDTERDTLSNDGWWQCSKSQAEKYYLDAGREYPVYESNIPLIRRKLAKSRGNVTLLTTGSLTTLLPLMESKPDEYSPLDGCSLFREKVGHYVCGGGKFPEGTQESNFLCDPEAADVVINKYLKGYPVTFFGAEVAGGTLSGIVMMQDKYKDYILRDIYLHHRPYDCNHNSWDLGTMHYAIFGTTYPFFEVKRGYTVEPYGTGGCMRLYEGGCHEYVVRRGSYEILTDTFNEMIVPRDF